MEKLTEEKFLSLLEIRESTDKYRIAAIYGGCWPVTDNNLIIGITGKNVSYAFLTAILKKEYQPWNKFYRIPYIRVSGVTYLLPDGWIAVSGNCQ